MKLLCHIAALYQLRYLKYALICASTLINNGGIHPSQIYITINNTVPANYLRLAQSLGVCLRTINKTSSFTRFTLIETLFESTDCSHIIQIDSDSLLMGNHNLTEFAARHRDDFISCYETNEPFANLYTQKKSVTPITRFNFALWYYQIDEKSLLTNTSKWLWGNFYLINRKVSTSTFWRAAVMLNEILFLNDDEMSASLANHIDNKLSYITDLPLTTVSDGLGTVKDGLVHYAGAHSKTVNAQYIDQLFNQLSTNRISF